MNLFTSTWTAAKYAILCISVCLFSGIHAKACGPDFTGWQYTLLLEHYTFNNKFFPYQFDPSNRFYALSWQDNNEEGNSVDDETKYNIAEWRTYLKLPSSIHDSDIKQFIYNNSSASLEKLILKNKSNNSIETILLNKKNAQEILHYLQMMNMYTEIMAPSKDAWDYSTYTKTISLDTISPFITKCDDLIKKTGDVFLQWRFLYLILRASHFNKHHALAIAEFEKNYPNITKDNSLAQYWCEGVYAGALLRTGHNDQAIYYSARAFANCPDQHLQAMNTYLFSNRNWKSALPYCTSANDSVYVALLEGANHTLPDMEFIQLIYKANPNTEVLKLLWLREANKIEQYLLNRNDRDNKNIYYLNYETPIDMDSLYSATKTLLQFISLSEKIVNSAVNIPVKVTAGNTIAFYYYKKGDYRKAATYLEKIVSLPKDKIEQAQYQLLNSLITLKKNNQFDTPHFISLLDEFINTAYGCTNHHAGYYLLYNEIAPYLLSRKDTTAAFWAYTAANCFESDSFNIYSQDYSPESFNHSSFATYLLNHHFTIEQVSELKKDYIRQEGNSAFETYLISKTKLIDGTKLFSLVIARKYMLTEKWEQALDMYNELPATYTERMGPNPANFHINDYIEDDSLQLKKNTYSIKQILELAQRLKKVADENTASSARDKVLYASLLYNLSFYGKNHYILDNHWNHSMSETAYYDYDSIDTHLYLNGQNLYDMPLHKNYQNYFHLTIAEKYLKEALPLLKTEEEKARCTFLLAKCWQKQCPRKMKYNTEYKYMEDISDYVGNSTKNLYFITLSTLYKNTKIQEEIFNSCSYYRMYLGKK